MIVTFGAINELNLFIKNKLKIEIINLFPQTSLGVFQKLVPLTGFLERSILQESSVVFGQSHKFSIDPC
jgi:hypothetical protein